MNILTRTLFSFFVSIIISHIISPIIISKFKTLNLNQSLRDKSEVRELADLHALKEEIPTMGGLIMLIPVILCTLFFAKLNILVVTTLVIYIGLSALGAADDILKIVKKNTKGVSGKIKLTVQLFLTIGCFFLLKNNPGTEGLTSTIVLPYFYGATAIVSSAIMLIFFFIVLAGSSNAVNLTDGLDGLAGFQIFINAIFWCFACYILGTNTITQNITPGIQELAIICSSLAGATLIFLWHNCSPATIFMGDMGSLGIGGVFGIIAIVSQRPLLLTVTGFIFVAEAISVILQVYYFKLTRGKRIFKMAPLHHHFELEGFKEQKIVIRALILTTILSLLAAMLLFIY